MFLLSMNIITVFSVSSTNCYGTKNVERPRYMIPLRSSIQSTIRCLYRTRDIIKNLNGRKRNFYIIFGDKVLKGLKLFFEQGEPSSILMGPELLYTICATFQGLINIESFHGSCRRRKLIATFGKDQGGPIVGLYQP